MALFWALSLISCCLLQLGDLNDEIITNTDGSQSTIPGDARASFLQCAACHPCQRRASRLVAAAYLSTNYNYQFSFHWQVRQQLCLRAQTLACSAVLQVVQASPLPPPNRVH